MAYKAIFFDRDGTLTYFNPQKQAWRDATVSAWSGKPFELPYEKDMALMAQAGQGRKPWYRTLDDEREFFRRYYRLLLRGEGVTENLDARAAQLLDQLWCNGDRLVHADVPETLEHFRSRGYRMGVISDTSPSLEYTLVQLGIAEYFTSFTASSLVGAGKPSPIIFNAALTAQHVDAAQSLYVDDCLIEAQGARELGFTSFWLDRSCNSAGQWTIHSLRELVEFDMCGD